MDESRKYQVEITAERLLAAQGPLTRALMVQNARFGARLDTSKLIPALRAFGLTVCALGIALALLLLGSGPRDRDFTLTMLAVFVAASPVFAFAPWLRSRLRGWSRRTAGRMLARNAARMLRRLMRWVPYTVDYEIDGAMLLGRCAKLKLDSRTALGTYRLALVDRDVLFVFNRRNALRPARLLFVPTAADGDALRAALERAGVPVENVPTEHPPGY